MKKYILKPRGKHNVYIKDIDLMVLYDKKDGVECEKERFDNSKDAQKVLKRLLITEFGEEDRHFEKNKTIVFTMLDLIRSGEQEITINFPYIGKIIDFNCHCGEVGDKNTLIEVKKISEEGYKNNDTWQTVISNIEILKNEKVNNSFSIINDEVNENDYFKVNVLQSGNITNLFLEVIIEI